MGRALIADQIAVYYCKADITDRQKANAGLRGSSLDRGANGLRERLGYAEIARSH